MRHICRAGSRAAKAKAGERLRRKAKSIVAEPQSDLVLTFAEPQSDGTIQYVTDRRQLRPNESVFRYVVLTDADT